MATPPVQAPTLLLETWGIGHNTDNQEPSLIISTTDGQRFAVQMPGITAQEMGAALVLAGSRAARADDSKPH